MSRKLKNREEIVEQMTDILVDFAKSCNQYQTDVYLYNNDKDVSMKDNK